MSDFNMVTDTIDSLHNPVSTDSPSGTYGRAELQTAANNAITATETSVETLYQTVVAIQAEVTELQAAVTSLEAGVSSPLNTVVPSIAGTAAVGDVQTASPGSWTGAPTGYAYEWFRGTTPISGATSSTYTLVTADAGNAITVGVIATNTTGSSAQALSAPTGTVSGSGTSPTLTADTPPNTAMVGTAYTGYQFAASGTGTITWSVSSGSLPAGLTLSTSGYLSGTPTAAATSTFEVTATNASGSAATSTLTITTSAPAGGATEPSNYSTQTYANHTNPFVNSFARPLGTTTVAPMSAAMVANLVEGVTGGSATDPNSYGLGINRQPVFVVPSSQALVTITGTVGNTGGHIPIPTAAQALSGGTDLPLIIFQPGSDKVWEVWEANYSNGAWTCGNAGVLTGIADSTGVFTGGSGVAASGISYGALTITQNDVASGVIAHTVGLYLSNEESTQFWPPADRADGGTTSVPGQVAEGMWFRFPAGSTMPSSITNPLGQMIWTAMRDYGCVLHDRANGSYFAVEDQATWAANGQTGTDPITTAEAGQPDYSVVSNIPLGSLQQIIPPILGYPAQAAPGAPSAVTVTVPGSSTGELAVSWTAPSSPTSMLFYVVQYRVTGSGSSGWQLLSPNPTGVSTTISGLTPGTEYDVQVYAVNANASGSTGTVGAGSSVATGTPSGSAPNQVTLVGSELYGPSAFTTSVVLDLPAGSATGDTVYAGIATYSTQTITPPSGAVHVGGSTNNNQILAVYRYVLLSGDVSTGSISFGVSTGNQAAGVLVDLRGVPGSPEDVVGTVGTGSGTAVTVPGVTTTATYDMILVFVGCADSYPPQASLTFSSPLVTQQVSVNSSDYATIGVATITEATAGATGNFTATWGATAQWTAVAIAVKHS